MRTRSLVVCYGGTFDPVHLGHVDAVDAVRSATGCDALHLIPCRVSPHKSAPGASGAQRCAMLELALAGRPDVTVDRRELERPGPSFTVDTLLGLRAELGPQVALGWLLGADALAGLERWDRWQRLAELAHLLVLDRPGSERPAAGPVAALLDRATCASAAELRAAPAGRVWFVRQPPRAISASEVRRRLAAEGECDDLLPPEVSAYISDHGLYGVVQA